MPHSSQPPASSTFFLKALGYGVGLPPAAVLTIKHGIGIAGILLIVCCVLSLCFHQGSAHPLSRQDRHLLFGMTLYPAVILLNTLYFHPEFEFAHLDYAFRFLFVLPVFLALRCFKLNSKHFYYGILFGSIGAGIFAIYQRYFLGILSVKGFVFHISFGDISLVLGFLSLCAWPVLKTVCNRKIASLVIVTAFSLAMTGAILSTARGSWIAAPVLFLILLNKSISGVKPRVLTAMIFISACLILYTGSEQIKSRVDLAAAEVQTYFSDTPTYDLSTNSVGSRLEMWKVGWQMFTDNPWTGIGNSNFYRASGKMIKAGKMIPGAHYDHAHSDYINLLAETGIPGFLALLTLYYFAWSYFRAAEHVQLSPQDQSLALSGQLLIAGYAVFSMTQSNLTHQVTVFFLALMITILSGLLNGRRLNGQE